MNSKEDHGNVTEKFQYTNRTWNWGILWLKPTWGWVANFTVSHRTVPNLNMNLRLLDQFIYINVKYVLIFLSRPKCWRKRCCCSESLQHSFQTKRTLTKFVLYNCWMTESFVEYLDVSLGQSSVTNPEVMTQLLPRWWTPPRILYVINHWSTIYWDTYASFKESIHLDCGCMR